MEVSADELNDWAQNASDLEGMIEAICRLLLDENVSAAADIADAARPQAHLLARSIIRAVNPTSILAYQPHYDIDLLVDCSVGRSESSLRAAASLERAALHVLALEREHGIDHGLGETLADYAAELNLRVHGQFAEDD